MDDEEFTYYFSHEDYVVFGGVALKGKEFSKVQENITAEITQKVQKILPQFNESKISNIQTGVRPGRKNVRFETEYIENTKIIHNYGHEGLGYTYAWGCASSVVEKLK
jgi:D-amino-acid oxidase